MKSFTAKEFSRCPAKVYEAAREDGMAYVSHDRHKEPFVLLYEGAVDRIELRQKSKKATD